MEFTAFLPEMTELVHLWEFQWLRINATWKLVPNSGRSQEILCWNSSKGYRVMGCCELKRKFPR